MKQKKEERKKEEQHKAKSPRKIEMSGDQTRILRRALQKSEENQANGDPTRWRVNRAYAGPYSRLVIEVSRRSNPEQLWDEEVSFYVYPDGGVRCCHSNLPMVLYSKRAPIIEDAQKRMLGG